MKRVLFLAFALVAWTATHAAAQNNPKPAEQKVRLPELHVIKSATLAPSYSCRTPGEFQKGYNGPALFLSDDRNDPDLLFNGACKSEDYLEAVNPGDSMSLIADLGEGVNLEEISAHLAFNLKNVHSFPAYTKFARMAPVVLNHTYVVLLNSSWKRGLFLFTVTDYVKNERLELKYAVKEYQLLRGVDAQSPGFSWEQKSAAAPAPQNAEKAGN